MDRYENAGKGKLKVIQWYTGKLFRAVVIPWKELQIENQFLACISGYVPNAGMLCMRICNRIITGKVNERAIR